MRPTVRAFSSQFLNLTLMVNVTCGKVVNQVAKKFMINMPAEKPWNLPEKPRSVERRRVSGIVLIAVAGLIFVCTFLFTPLGKRRAKKAILILFC